MEVTNNVFKTERVQYNTLFDITYNNLVIKTELHFTLGLRCCAPDSMRIALSIFWNSSSGLRWLFLWTVEVCDLFHRSNEAVINAVLDESRNGQEEDLLDVF